MVVINSCVCLVVYVQVVSVSYRVSHLTGAPQQLPKSVRLDSKSHQKGSKCQNLLIGLDLEFLGGTS